VPPTTAPAHFLTLSSGRRLAYAEYGDPHGTPLFYFHGWPSSRLQGALLHDLGKARRLRIIAADRPGLGQSEYHAGRQLLDWPPLLQELASHLGVEKFHVLGVSGGGPYVLAAAHAMPERLLSAGVICGAPPLKVVGTSDLMWTYRLGLWAQRYTPFMLSPGLAVSARLMDLPPDSRLLKAYVSRLCARDQSALADKALFRILMESGREGLLSGARALSTDGSIYTSDWGFDLTTVTYPIHYWHGALDSNIPVSSIQRFVQHLPNARLNVTPDDGHYSLPLIGSEAVLDAMLTGP